MAAKGYVIVPARVGLRLRLAFVVTRGHGADYCHTPLQEKRKTRKALELKKSLEVRVEPVQQHCVQLQEEVASLRAQLRAAKQQVKQASGQERELQEARRLQEEEQEAVERELDRMRTLLESTNLQLKKEGEVRIRDMARVKQGMDNRACGYGDPLPRQCLYLWDPLPDTLYDLSIPLLIPTSPLAPPL